MDFVDKPACKSQSVRYYVIQLLYFALITLMRLAGGSLEKLNRITILYYTLRVAAASFGLSLSIRTPQQDYGDASSKIVIILNCCAPVLAAAGQCTVYTCGRLPSIDVPLERMPVSTNVD